MTAPRPHAELAARDTSQVVPERRGMKQRGYFDFNVTGFIIGCLIVGAAIGIGVAYLVPWLWSFIKPLIHALTA